MRGEEGFPIACRQLQSLWVASDDPAHHLKLGIQVCRTGRPGCLSHGFHIIQVQRLFCFPFGSLHLTGSQ